MPSLCVLEVLTQRKKSTTTLKQRRCWGTQEGTGEQAEVRPQGTRGKPQARLAQRAEQDSLGRLGRSRL